MLSHLPKVSHVARDPGTLWPDSSEHGCLGDSDHLGLSGGGGAAALVLLINNHNQGRLSSINPASHTSPSTLHTLPLVHGWQGWAGGVIICTLWIKKLRAGEQLPYCG